METEVGGGGGEEGGICIALASTIMRWTSCKQ